MRNREFDDHEALQIKSPEADTDVSGENCEGSGRKQAQEATIRDIQSGRLNFCSGLPSADHVDVITADSRFGNKDITTKSDADKTNNSIALPAHL